MLSVGALTALPIFLSITALIQVRDLGYLCTGWQAASALSASWRELLQRSTDALAARLQVTRLVGRSRVPSGCGVRTMR